MLWTGALGDLVPVLIGIHCWSGGLMDTAPETQIHTEKMKVKFTYIGARWPRHQESKWECKREDSKDVAGMGIDRKCLEPQTTLLAWTSFDGETPGLFCLKYVCHVWPLMMRVFAGYQRVSNTSDGLDWMQSGKSQGGHLQGYQNHRMKNAQIYPSLKEERKIHKTICLSSSALQRDVLHWWRWIWGAGE